MRDVRLVADPVGRAASMRVHEVERPPARARFLAAPGPLVVPDPEHLERYERAAELRDAIRLIKTRPEVES